ncbi:uncharacterized protein LOC134612752 [Pelobates fuscus]|uniref:uncharacterized protein LOC134612752 n=1 Tax=Pelobates fuscus TaxID=191477 RepID=UPI002FE4E6B8
MEQTGPKAAAPPSELNIIDTPRTSHLKFLREKRLNYFNGKQSTSTLSSSRESPRSGSNVSMVFQQPKRSKTPRKCRSAPSSRLEQSSSISNGRPKFTDLAVAKTLSHTPEITQSPLAQAEVCTSEPSTQRSLLRSSFISGLDQELLEDSSVPEAQKLQHVMTWAKKFLNQWNCDDSLQNVSMLSQDNVSLKSLAIPVMSTNEGARQPFSYTTANPSDRLPLNKSRIASIDSSFNPLYNKDTSHYMPEELKVLSSLSKSTKCDLSIDSDIIQAKTQPSFQANDKELFVHSGQVAKRHSQISRSTTEMDSLSSEWNGVRNRMHPRDSLNVTIQHASAHHKNYFTDPYIQIFSPKVKHGFHPNTSSNQNDINLIKQIHLGRGQDGNEEEEDMSMDFSKYAQLDYDSDSTITESVGSASGNYHEREDGQSSSMSSLDTERLNDFLVNLEKLHKESEITHRSTLEEDGLRTDRTFFVKKFVESNTPRRYISSKEAGSLYSPAIENQSYSAHSAKYLQENSKTKLHKVCPVCSFTSETNSSWCAGCGSVLFVTQSQIPTDASEKNSQVAKGTLLDEMFVSTNITNSQNNLENKPSSTLKEKESKRVLCWEDGSDITSDSDGSVLEKYLFYVNKLENLKIEEQKKTSDNISTTNSNEVSSEDESSVDLRGPHLHSSPTQYRVFQIDDKSDSEESETQFLGATNALVSPGSTYPEAQANVNNHNLFTNNLKDIHGTTIKGSVDRKLQKSSYLPSRITGPIRYWEKSSIAWSSYTHGELKPRSACLQRPVSAEATKKMPYNKYEGDNNSDHHAYKKINHSERPTKISPADVADYQNSAVAYMKTTNASAISEHLSKRKWNGVSEMKNWDLEGDRGSLWLHLPDELWICVFSNLSHKDLSNVAQVCQRFRLIANDDSLWKVIKITNCHSLNDTSLTTIGRHHPKSLSLYRCHDDNQCITDSGLGNLFQNCKDSLMTLEITHCSGPRFDGDTILFHTSKYCSQITSLDISWTAATDKGVIALVEFTACLKSLSVNGCKISDHAICNLVKKHCNSLIKLEVFGCHELTSRCLCSVATECTHLQILNIGRVPKVTDTCLAKIASNLHQMTTLNVTGINTVRDRTVHYIVKQCSKLENLTLSSCCQVTDVSLVEISTYLQTIKYLDLSGCKKVTDIGIQALARSCRQISYLDLSSTGTGKRGICLLASYCYNSLECLKLSFCKEVTPDAIEKLCKNCKRLKVLHLYGCRISQDLDHIKRFSENSKIFHDLSIPTANILGE